MLQYNNKIGIQFKLMGEMRIVKNFEEMLLHCFIMYMLAYNSNWISQTWDIQEAHLLIITFSRLFNKFEII